MAAEVNALDITTLVIAVVGAVTGVAGLVWAVTSHLLNGPRVVVTVRAGARNRFHYATASLDTYKPGGIPAELDQSVVAIQLNNKGRSPIQVTGYGIGVGQVSYGEVGQVPGSQPIPHLLGPGEEATWMLDGDGVVEILRSVNAAELYGFANLGTGKKAVSRRYPARSLNRDAPAPPQRSGLFRRTASRR